jgi:hypothetical protein
MDNTNHGENPVFVFQKWVFKHRSPDTWVIILGIHMGAAPPYPPLLCQTCAGTQG